MPENRLEHLIHVGPPPQNRLKPGNPDGHPDIVELGKATRWKPGQSGNPGGRPKRTPYADACRSVGDLTDFEDKPGDPGHVKLAKALMRHALSERMGAVQAAAELMDRAEGRPVQAITQQQDESSIAALGPELFAATVRIILARCEAFNLPVPDFLAEAQRMVESGELDQSAEDKCKTG